MVFVHMDGRDAAECYDDLSASIDGDRRMRVLVTGSSGHLGEALVRTLGEQGHEVVSLDILAGAYTSHVGTVTDRAFVERCMRGVQTVFHTATLHKPHVATHGRQDFVDTNISGTLNLLEEAVAAGVESFVYTSTTSVFGDALVPPPGEPAAWVTEEVRPVLKNIYGVTKSAAEDFCQLFHRKQKLPCIVLRTSRFFPEADDDKSARLTYSDDNLKVNEYLSRRVDIEDVVGAHLLAAKHAKEIGFRRYIVSATTPFTPDDMADLRSDVARAANRRVPKYASIYAARGWKLPSGIDRVYVNALARSELGWRPKHDFGQLLRRLAAGEDFRSPMALAVGSKGYHVEAFAEGPYPVD